LKQFVFFFLSFYYFLGVGQEKYPKDYFLAPLKIPIILSGSFGELRNNHFHSGLDIKTQGKEGLEVISVADGYVSRIKISQFGYGKSIYVTHPNGFTSVYAHLSKFAPPIEDFVKFYQYKNENYETGDLYFTEDKFPLLKGDLIAYSGDTGGSAAPHLHFEIRETVSEKVVNPLLFGFAIQDSISPIFESLMMYILNDTTPLNSQKINFQLPIKKINKDTFTTDKISANNQIGFGVQVFDKTSDALNRLGVYSLEMLVNGKRFFYHILENFSFLESKYINLHIDYEHLKRYKKRLEKTYIETFNPLSTYREYFNNGKITIEKDMNYNIDIVAKDYFGNTSYLKIPVVGKENNFSITKQIDTTAFKVIAKKFNKFSLENVTIAFPKKTFYEDTYLDFKIENGIAKIHNPTIPLDDQFTLTFDVTKYSEEEKKQLYIANLEYPKYHRYQNTRKKDSTFYTTTKTLGDYSLIFDNQKPIINLLYFKNRQWISNSDILQVKISDIGSGINTYKATIDNEWILMEYNHKTGILTYNFNDKKLVGSEHLFKIVVCDNVGNTNELSATFFKKQVN